MSGATCLRARTDHREEADAAVFTFVIVKFTDKFLLGTSKEYEKYAFTLHS